jgi:hypothetical protein
MILAVEELDLNDITMRFLPRAIDFGLRVRVFGPITLSSR